MVLAKFTTNVGDVLPGMQRMSSEGFTDAESDRKSNVYK